MTSEDPSPDQVEPEPLSASSDEESGRELVLRAREGDRDAAYEVLGRQFPVDTWVAVLQGLADKPEGVDLELVAHRTLRRTPEVVGAVLSLASATASPQALFLASVARRVRSEAFLVERATSIEAELSEAIDLDELLAQDDGLGALYAILARPLSDERDVLSKLGPDSETRNVVIDAMRVEYERLQEVSRDSRWRSGSYRHVLRHSLADLALLAGVGGRLEDNAYRLLQQRTEEPSANAELLGLMPEESRSRYLAWTLERTAADAEPARALFALEQVGERFPDAVDRSTIAHLLDAKSLDVATAAARQLVRAADDSTYDSQIATLVGSADGPQRRALAAALLSSAPERLRIDLIPPDADEVLLDGAGADPDGFARQLVLLMPRAHDPEAFARLTRLLAAVGDQHGLDAELAGRVALLILTNDKRGVISPALRIGLASVSLRSGVWAALPQVDESMRGELVDLLVDHDEPTSVWGNLVHVFESLDDDSRTDFAGKVLSAVIGGRVEMSNVAESPPDDLAVSLQADARREAESAVRELERLEGLIRLGERAAWSELAELVGPLVDRATERSVGDDRSRADYRRVKSAIQVELPAEDSAVLAPEWDDAEFLGLQRALAKVGLTLSVEREDVSVAIPEGVEEATLIRCFALVDQRVAKTGIETPAHHTGSVVLSGLAAVFGRRGTAARALGELFERGPLFQLVVTLSPAARDALLLAASENGFVPPAEWTEHAALGSWLRTTTSEGGDVESAEPSPVQTLSVLQGVHQELRAADDRLQAGRIAARAAFVSQAQSAFEDLELTMDTWVQFWRGLADLGITQIAALGEVLEAGELDPQRHEIVGSDRGASYIVRSAGIDISGEIVRRARVEVVS